MSRRTRLVAAGLWGLAVAHVAEAVVLRRRAGRIGVLPQSDGSDPTMVPGAVAEVVTAGGPVDDGSRRAVGRLLAETDLDAVDLVPGDLPADRALRLVRRIDPARLRSDPLHAPGGAHEAVALRAGLASRMGTAGGPLPVAERVPFTMRAQRYAPTSADLRVAPELRAGARAPRDRWDELEQLTAFARTHGPIAALLVAAEAVHLAALAVGPVIAPAAGLAAAATWSAQPALVFGRRGLPGPAPALRPPDLGRAGAFRLARAASGTLRTAATGVAAARARARTRPPVPATPPADVLFEPRRAACPWCGSEALALRLELPDLLQHKQGTFRLDECRSCGHVFQNPALSLRGLDHYYAEFYDGAGEEPWECAFAAMGAAYRQRVDAIARFATPEAWLDVGTGHGHFCLVARQRWPSAVVDGLDLSESVDEAARRGWIDTAYRGLFPDLAGGLPRSYDVVTMHHYLEHTRDPRAELEAAAKVLAPGGHLMIEGPDVESPWARRLGRYWRCWFQPQHQHFVTCANLVAALEERGFEVVDVERGSASEGMDLTSGVLYWLSDVAPDTACPWRPPPSVADRARRTAALAAASPLLAVAAGVDMLKDAYLRHPRVRTPGNAYRVIARRI